MSIVAKCSKFERNQSMGRLFLCDLKFCAKKKKNVKKIGQFLRTNISRSTKAIFFNFDM